MTPTLDGSRHFSIFWRQRRKCMEQNGPKLEQHWLSCGSKGLTNSMLFFLLFANSACIITVFFINRGLRFVQVFLQSLVDGEKDDNNPNLIRVNITKAYEIALKKYHGWLVHQLFKVSLVYKTWLIQDRRCKTCVAKWCVNMAYLFAFRQHFLLLHISQISWRPCPRVGTWRKRTAWRKSENSSSTSLPLLMLFMRCTVKWMLILTTQCDFKSFHVPFNEFTSYSLELYGLHVDFFQVIWQTICVFNLIIYFHFEEQRVFIGKTL